MTNNVTKIQGDQNENNLLDVSSDGSIPIYLDLAGGPVLASGLPSLLRGGKLTSIQGYNATTVTITSTAVGDKQLNCAAGLLKLLAPGQIVKVGGSVTEWVKVSKDHVPTTTGTSVPLESPVVNAGNTSATFLTFSSIGPGGGSILPINLLPFVGVMHDVVSGNYYSLKTANGNAQAAQVPLAVGGLLYNGATWDMPQGMQNATYLASAARTTTQTQVDQTNVNARGIRVTLVVTSAGTGSITLEIDDKDVASGTYPPLLTGAAVTTNSTNVYTVYPGATVTANVSANAVLGRTWRILVTANNANSMTYSVGYELLI